MLQHISLKVNQSTELSFIPSLKHHKIVSKFIIDFYSKPLSVYVIEPLSKKLNEALNQLQILVDIPQSKFVDSIEKHSNEIDICLIARQLIEFTRIGITSLCQIGLSNCFLCGNRIKVFVKESVNSERQFLEKVKEVLLEVVKTNKAWTEQVKEIATMREIDILYEKLRKREEKCYSIENICKSKIQCKPYKSHLVLSQAEMRWILEVTEQSTKKTSLICKASEIHFNASEIHKLIAFKGPLLYILFTKTHIVAFYSVVVYKPNFELFGNYFGDSSLHSKVLSVTHKTIHSLIDEKKSVGYGSQCLIAIGEIDIVITSGNLQNICEFPRSYRADEQDIVHSAEKLIGGRKFTLQQMDIYQISEVKQEKEIK